jgi:PRC-barrel domain
MKQLVMVGAATLLAVPILAFAQGRTSAPRNNDAADSVLAQATAPTQPGAARPTAVDAVALRSGIRTSKVVGSSVYNEARDDIGAVDDIIIPRSGAPVAIISVGGFLGIGSRYVAIPLSEMQLGQNDRWTLPRATKEYLKTLPPFTYDTPPMRG